mgnify:CR=1 FL=1
MIQSFLATRVFRNFKKRSIDHKKSKDDLSPEVCSFIVEMERQILDLQAQIKELKEKVDTNANTVSSNDICERDAT